MLPFTVNNLLSGIVFAEALRTQQAEGSPRAARGQSKCLGPQRPRSTTSPDRGSIIVPSSCGEIDTALLSD